MIDPRTYDASAIKYVQISNGSAHSHSGSLVQRQHSAFNAPVVGVVEVPQHLSILLPSIHFEELAGWRKCLASVFYQAEERAQWQAFVQMQQNMVDCF